MSVDNSQILSFLEKIKGSRHFCKSKVSCDLLSYLVQATLSGENPKEYTIGIELFGKKYDQDAKTDSNIRVYIHKVRKRLQDYYQEDGKDDEVIFEIAKGQYRVNFIEKEIPKKNLATDFRTLFFITLGLLIAMICVFFISGNTHQSETVQSPILKKFTEREKKTLLVVGDYFVYQGAIPTSSSGVIRDFGINSAAEFEKRLVENPELLKQCSKSNLTYLSKMSVFCQHEIMRAFGSEGKNIDVKLLSDLQPDDLQSHHVIFVGNYKNMGLLEQILKDRDVDYNDEIAAYLQRINTSDDPCETELLDKVSITKTDYALVMSFKNFTNNEFLVFLSRTDIGNISTVNLFLDGNYMKEFIDEYLEGDNEKEFKALYQVEGINKTNLSYQLITVD
ncbi:hypothetical protein EYV94_16295 [Puteibacter caeruleilacunae]|nr:hypothetical protein EYV94_16295 [Puteibacter caeruleilacunae]